MFLTDYVIGTIEDNAGYFLNQRKIYKIGVIYGEKIKSTVSSQPILQDTLAYLTTQSNPISLFNLYVISALILNLLSSFILFKKQHTHNISLLLAVTYSSAPFILFKAQNHPALVATWVLNLGLILILNHRFALKRALIVGLYIAFATLASNYYGYFLILFAGIYYGIIAIQSFLKKFFKEGILIILKLVLALVISAVVVLISIFPYFKANYLGEKTQNVGTREVVIDGKATTIVGSSWKIENNVGTNQEYNTLTLNRTLEDFFYFTSRPWYYVLPSKSNIFFGSFTGFIIDKLQSIPGNWLAQNYFVREHSASYLGWANIILAIIGITYIKKKNPAVFKEKNLGVILITIGALIILTMPPYFTISGIKIYMPSYLLYMLFPMFRTLTRLGILILPLIMIFSGYGYAYLFRSKKGILIATFLFIFSIAEFIVPIKITPADYKSSLFIQLDKDLPKDAVLAVLPDEDANIVVFNIDKLKRPFINPKGYNAPEFDFNSEQFTENLPTCKGILEARNLGVTHILVYGRENKLYEKQREFFRTSTLIGSSQQYPEEYSEIFEIKKNIDYEKEKEECLNQLQK